MSRAKWELLLVDEKKGEQTTTKSGQDGEALTTAGKEQIATSTRPRSTSSVKDEKEDPLKNVDTTCPFPQDTVPQDTDALVGTIAPFPTPAPVLPVLPGAFATTHVGRSVPPHRVGSRNREPPVSIGTTSVTGTVAQEELFRGLHSSTTTISTISSSDDEDNDDDCVPLLSALLISDPPKDFDNWQICMAACDSGQGWEACQDVCVPGATFSCQNDTLGDITSVEDYANFIAFFGTACPNARWTTHDVSWDGTVHTAFFHCTYHVTHTVSVPGLGPVQPTLKSSDSNYGYVIKTDPERDGKIVHIQKLWNDTWMLRDLGWLPPAGPTSQNQAVVEAKGAPVPSSTADKLNTSASPIKKKKKRTWRAKPLLRFLRSSKMK